MQAMLRPLWLLAAGSLLALEPDATTLFLCRFDTSARADYSVGSPEAHGVVCLVPGREGQALSVPRGLVPAEQALAPITTGIQYDTEGNLNLAEGTLEMWVNPRGRIVQPEAGAPKLRYLCHSAKYTTANHAFALVLTRFGQADEAPYRLLWTRGNGAEKERNWSLECPIDWEPGQWHHVAVTWSAREDRLFVDGRLRARTATGEGMDLLGPTFAVGATMYHSHVADCAIDDVRISGTPRYTGDAIPSPEPRGE